MLNKLQELREQKEWSREQLANRVGVTRMTIFNIEKGRYDPSLSLAFALAEVFGTTVEGVFKP